MSRYILNRVLWGALTALSAVTVVFVIFQLLPTADPAQLRAGRLASPEEIERIRDSMGLNDPVYVQYWLYLKGLLLHFDLGYSYEYRAPVADLIAERLPATAFLVAGAAVLWLAIGIPTGILSAVRPGSWMDRAAMVSALALISAPVFWLGLVALYLFSADVGEIAPIFPGIGAYIDAESVPAKAWALSLPWLVMAFSSAAIYARYMRSSLLETMSSDYVRTARAKGLPEGRVIRRHGVRGALVPVVTLLGLDIGMLLAGNAILTETVFNIPGVGRLVADSIERADLPVIQGVVLVGALFIIAFSLIVDLLYAWLDPRVRLR